MARSRRLGRTEYQALAEFRFQLRRFLRFSEATAKAQGLTASQYQLLLQVKGFREPRSPSVGELAERLQTVPHAVVALLTRCEHLGLVERVAAQNDRRQVQVRLTAAGERAVARIATLNTNELVSLSGVFRVPRLSALNDRS